MDSMIVFNFLSQSALKKTSCGSLLMKNSTARQSLRVTLDGSPSLQTMSLLSAMGGSSSPLHHLVSRWQPKDAPDTQYCALGIFLAAYKNFHKYLGKINLIVTNEKVLHAFEFFWRFKRDELEIIAAP
jgi:hypothetical protein